MNRNLIRIATATVGAAVATTAFGLSSGSQAHAASSTPAYGWSAVIHHPKGADDNRGTLKMVGPSLQQITIGEVSDTAQVVDVRNDGSYVITSKSGINGTTDFAIWNTHTRTAKFLKLGGDWGAAFTPSGLVTWRSHDVEGPNVTALVYQRDLSGKATGRIAAPSTSSFSVHGDGSKLLEFAGKNVKVRSTATGATLSTRAMPSSQCWGVQEWSPGTFQIECQGDYGLGLGPGYLMSYNGSTAPKRISPDKTYSVMATTPVTAFQYDKDQLKVQTPTSAQPLPGGVTVNGSYATGGWGRTVYFIKSKPVPNGNEGTLQKYDMNTGKVITVAGGSRGGVITSAQTIDGHR